MPRSTLCLLALLLTACGQSGALYLPDQAPPKPTLKARMANPGNKPAADAPTNAAASSEESKSKKDDPAAAQP